MGLGKCWKWLVGLRAIESDSEVVGVLTVNVGEYCSKIDMQKTSFLLYY